MAEVSKPPEPGTHPTRTQPRVARLRGSSLALLAPQPPWRRRERWLRCEGVLAREPRSLPSRPLTQTQPRITRLRGSSLALLAPQPPWRRRERWLRCEAVRGRASKPPWRRRVGLRGSRAPRTSATVGSVGLGLLGRLLAFRLVAVGPLAAADRCRRRGRRCPRAGRRGGRTASGTVKIVKSCGSASSTSSQRDRRRDAGVGEAAHGVRRGDGVVAGVLVVVDEQLVRVAVLAPPQWSSRRRASGARPRGRRRARRGVRP